MVVMAGAPMKVLLTGPPGCGKTTAVVKIVAALDQRVRMAGFYTEEIRAAGRRVGFRWHRLDGRTGTLAHVKVKSPHHVSKYGVDLASFEGQAVSILNPEMSDVDLFVIDEIGKMECFSEKFVEAIRRLLQSHKSVLATVAERGPGLVQQVKSYPGVELLPLSRGNREEVIRQVADRLVSSVK
jgi:nucleoside-triphosphatase